MKQALGFTLLEVLVALAVLLSLLLGFVIFQNVSSRQAQSLKTNQAKLVQMQNQLELLRSLPYEQIQTQALSGVIVNEIKPGLKEILVVSGNLQLYTRRANHP